MSRPRLPWDLTADDVRLLAQWYCESYDDGWRPVRQAMCAARPPATTRHRWPAYEQNSARRRSLPIRADLAAQPPQPADCDAGTCNHHPTPPAPESQTVPPAHQPDSRKE